MENSLISVIVPVYNVEKYLDRCLESIVGQTYRNLEIILVDDGSSDSCPQLCDEWAQKDSRICVIHKENGGVSSARNVGLEQCTGEYIGFIDPDDFITNDMYEKMISEGLQHDAEIVLCGYYLTQEGSAYQTVECFEREPSVLSKEEAFTMLCANRIGSHVWDKLFKRELFDGISFPHGVTYEDISVMHLLFLRAEKFIHLNTPLYYYEQRIGSIIATNSERNIREKFNSFFKRYSDLNEIANAYQHSLQLSVIACSYIGHCHAKGMKAKLKHIRSFLKSEGRKFPYKKYLPRKYRIQWNLNALGFGYRFQYQIYTLLKKKK